jgi:hypothetical protein
VKNEIFPLRPCFKGWGVTIVVGKVLDFKEALDDRRIPLLAIKFRGRAVV